MVSNRHRCGIAIRSSKDQPASTQHGEDRVTPDELGTTHLQARHLAADLVAEAQGPPYCEHA